MAFDGGGNGDGDGEGDDDSYSDNSWSRAFYSRLRLTGNAIFSCLDSYCLTDYYPNQKETIAPKKGIPKLSSLLKVTADPLCVPVTMDDSTELIRRRV